MERMLPSFNKQLLQPTADKALTLSVLAGVYFSSWPARLNFPPSPHQQASPSMPPEMPQQTQTQGKHIRGPPSQQKSGPPPPTVHIHTAALHNRVTEEIKRTVLLQGCAWLSSLTHILSGNNGSVAVPSWLTIRWPESPVCTKSESAGFVISTRC